MRLLQRLPGPVAADKQRRHPAEYSTRPCTEWQKIGTLADPLRIRVKDNGETQPLAALLGVTELGHRRQGAIVGACGHAHALLH